MLVTENFTKKHVAEIAAQTHLSESLVERLIYAFGLLQSLALVKLPFIFKGGTSVILHLETPHRLSTDIDILVNPDTDIDKYIREASGIFPFIGYQEDMRTSNSTIIKRHFRFEYSPLTSQNPVTILLDVVFAENPYMHTIQLPVKNTYLISDDKELFVTVPAINSLVADKLTAFAPHTTGVLFGCGKNLEIIKQFFDISVLAEYISDIAEVHHSYTSVVAAEIAYRGNSISTREVLYDTINTALCIAGLGKIRKRDYAELKDGIDRIQSHIVGRYSADAAARQAGKIAYLAACLLTEQTRFTRISDTTVYSNMLLKEKPFVWLNFMKKIDMTCFGYLVETERLLTGTDMADFLLIE